MDCNTARLFLQLDSDADELRGHLDECAVCNRVAMDQERLDAHLGKAMRAVEVPRGLKDQLLQKLADEPVEKPQRRGEQIWKGVGLAALVVLSIGLIRFWFTPPRQALSGDAIRHAANAERNVAGAPTFANYELLRGVPTMAIVPGTNVQAAQFVFTEGKKEAVVYCVPRRKYEVEDVAPDRSYKYRLAVYRPDEYADRDFVYLIVYTGDTWTWLKAPEPVE